MGLEDSVEGDGWSLPIWDLCWKIFGMACWYQGSFCHQDSKDRIGVIFKSFVILPNGMAWIESQFHPRKQRITLITFRNSSPCNQSASVFSNARNSCSLSLFPTVRGALIVPLMPIGRPSAALRILLHFCS